MDNRMKLLYDKYNLRKITKITMDYHDFNKLIQDHLPKLILNNENKYKNFDCVSEFEWGNDTNYDVTVTEDDLKEDSMYNEFDKKDIINGSDFINLHGVICFLIDHKILSYYGIYEVKVCW